MNFILNHPELIGITFLTFIGGAISELWDKRPERRRRRRH